MMFVQLSALKSGRVPPSAIELLDRGTELIPSEKQSLLQAYRRGAKYLRKREHAAGLGKRKPKVLAVLPSGKRCLFSKDAVGKQIVRVLAERFGVEEKMLREDAKFAEAVESIVKNCGQTAMRAIFDPEHPPSRKAIEKLSRTAWDRQRYRVDGFLAGHFKTIKPQGHDPVFDTVAFSEVPSRLWRARGSMLVLQQLLLDPVSTPIATECGVLVVLCLKAAKQLRQFVSARTLEIVVVPKSLRRERVQPILDRRDVRGKIVGKARGSLKLTIKSVWDYPEMQRRGLTASENELVRTRQELETIVTAANAILKPNIRSTLPRSGR